MSSKPKMRDNPFANEELSKALERVFTKHPFSFTINCFNCLHMKSHGEPQCQKYNMVPPVEVLTRGCQGYEDDNEIPF